MAGCKRERYKIEPRIYPLCWNWNMKAKSLKKLLVIKEICSWLPAGLDGQKVCSQEHIYKERKTDGNMFLAACWVGWTESLQPRTYFHQFFFLCKNRCFKTANIRILSANLTHTS